LLATLLEQNNKFLYFCNVAMDEDPLGGVCGSAAVLNLLASPAGEPFTQRQLDYWNRSGLLSPAAPPTGRKKTYTFEDVLRLRIIRCLQDGGLSTQKIRRALDHLQNAHERFGKPWHALRLFTDGDAVFALNGDNHALDVVKNQMVSLVLLGSLVEDAKVIFKKAQAA
jgi:DNA-binding transcriptional MerR regulator